MHYKAKLREPVYKILTFNDNKIKEFIDELNAILWDKPDVEPKVTYRRTGAILEFGYGDLVYTLSNGYALVFDGNGNLIENLPRSLVEEKYEVL